MDHKPLNITVFILGIYHSLVRAKVHLIRKVLHIFRHGNSSFGQPENGPFRSAGGAKIPPLGPDDERKDRPVLPATIAYFQSGLRRNGWLEDGDSIHFSMTNSPGSLAPLRVLQR
jgi:hypothetical protein